MPRRSIAGDVVRRGAWIDAAKPPAGVGFYPVVYCWDPAEGFFPGAARWNGAHWSSSPIVFYLDDVRATEKEAAAIAEANDLDDPR